MTYIWLFRVISCVLVIDHADADSAGQDLPEHFTDIEHTTETDADKALDAEMSATPENSARLHDIQQYLNSTYKTLPKTSDGRVGHQTARYMVHRYFVEQHGWYLKGLEAENKSLKMFLPQNEETFRSWIPNHLQERLEKKIMRRSKRHAEEATRDQGAAATSLEQVAQLVAGMEDIIHLDSEMQLRDIYRSLGFQTHEVLNHTVAEQLLEMYIMVYLSKPNMTIGNPDKNHKRLNKFKKMKFLPSVREEEDRLLTNMTAATFDFDAVLKWVRRFEQEFPSAHDEDCRNLEGVLLQMQGGSRKAGRIPLANFYNKSGYLGWHFRESAGYLRDLGALDESDPQRPQVIIANYVASLDNCMKATRLYALCCRSRCELLVTKLEELVAAPGTTADELLKLVAQLDAMSGRGQLEDKLVARLHQIAANNAGSVPLHGRLFAQWMHHVFPEQCPYPHESGATNPRTPDGWTQSSGKSAIASDDEVEAVLANFCPPHGGTPGCPTDENSELPWTDSEELVETEL